MLIPPPTEPPRIGQAHATTATMSETVGTPGGIPLEELPPPPRLEDAARQRSLTMSGGAGFSGMGGRGGSIGPTSGGSHSDAAGKVWEAAVQQDLTEANEGDSAGEPLPTFLLVLGSAVHGT